MTNIRARQPYARRPAPLGPLKPFLDTEFANIQRAVPVPLVRSVFADDTVQASDDTIEVDATAGAITVTLPPPDRLLFLRVTIVRVDAGSHNVIVAGALPDSSSVSLHTADDFITVQSDGTTWLDLSTPFPGYADVTRFGARGDGVADDRTAFANADAAAAAFGGAVFVPPGGYRIASNITMSSAVTMAAGAVLVPDNGVTVTFGGALEAGLDKIFDGSAGGFILFVRGAVAGIEPEWWGAGNFQSAAVNTIALQAAINAHVGLTVLNLSVQSSALIAPLMLNAVYPITTIVLPRFHELRGRSVHHGFSSVAAQPIIVLGRDATAPDTDWVDTNLFDLSITGSVAAAGQHGIYRNMTGAGAYLADIDHRRVTITNVGGKGVYAVGDNVANGIVGLEWNGVKVINSQDRPFHFKVEFFNVANFTQCIYSDCANGPLVEDTGTGAGASESVAFLTTRFENLGKVLGGSMAVGSVGFESTMSAGHYDFDAGCYFENCGNAAGDTTGALIKVKHPRMLSVKNTTLRLSNNMFWMKSGGNAVAEGNYIEGGPNMTSILTLESPPAGSDYSTFDFGANTWGALYAQAQLVRSLSSPTTIVTGYQGPTRNYLSIPPRTRLQVFRDGATKAVDDGAIGYDGVKRLANNSGGATTIVASGVATICLSTVHADFWISEYNNSVSAKFLCTPGGGLSKYAERGSLFSTTKNNLATINVYYESSITAWVVQNNLAGSILVSARLSGNEPMEHADDGYYETQFA